MKLLSVGSMNGVSNTCVHRHWAIKDVAEEVDTVNTSHASTIWYRITHHLFLSGLPLRLPDLAKANKQIREKLEKKQYDIVWIDKGLTITPETLQYIKTESPNTKIVSYSPDNMALRHNQSQQYLECVSLYDFFFTTKSYILDDMRKLGARRIYFVNNAFESRFHYPRILNDMDKKKLSADVCFIGAFEQERWESIKYLVDHGICVTVWGSGKYWGRYLNYSPNLRLHLGGLFSDDYAKSFAAAKINLCFLRKMNYDQQTTRTMEIPACGGFMLAERTEEPLALFKENEEAVFFGSNEELLEKCRYYLIHDDERKEIAKKGYKRCIDSDYSNSGMIRRAITIVMTEL